MSMKTKLPSLFIALALLAVVPAAAAQTAQFFRLVGPTAVTITKFRADGSIIWSGATPGTTYTVQTATSLAGGGNWANYVQLSVTQAVNTNLLIAFNPPAGMALIPAGSFTMGNSIGDSDITDANPTNVYVSGFFMDVNLVSSNQWAGVYSYALNHGYTFANAGLGKAANHPVCYVDWYDCVKWSNARSAQAGLTPVYYTDAGMTQVFTNGDNSTTVYANWGANGYRLPTEAEWEKAARGGLSGQRFPLGNIINENLADYYGATGIYSYDKGPDGYNAAFYTIYAYLCTSPVGYFAPNGYGLNDMAGNMSEWCWDWYGTPYGQPTNTNPTGPATGSVHAVRGGDWYDMANAARCANRLHYNPAYPFTTVGFRCVRGR